MPHKFSEHQCELSAYLDIRKGHAYDKVAGPVTAAGEGEGGRSRTLAEQFGYHEPGNRSRTNLKETHKEEDGRHAHVAHPRVISLKRRVQLVKKNVAVS